MPPGDIDGPDGLKTGFNNPGYEDEQGNCRSGPEDTRADQSFTSSRNNRTGILNTLRNDPGTGLSFYCPRTGTIGSPVRHGTGQKGRSDSDPVVLLRSLKTGKDRVAEFFCACGTAEVPRADPC